MGRKAQFLKGQRERGHDSRMRKAHRGEATSSQRIAGPGKQPRAAENADAPVRAHPARSFPDSDQQQLLMSNLPDAARLQPSSSDLCRALRALLPAANRRAPAALEGDDAAGATTGSSSSPKRVRSEGGTQDSGDLVAWHHDRDTHLVDGFTARAVWDAIRPELSTLIVDDVGSRVVETLIRGGGTDGDVVSAEARELCEEVIDAVIFSVNQAAVDRRSSLQAAVGDGQDVEDVDETVRISLAPPVTAEEAENEGSEFVRAPMSALDVTSLYRLATHTVGRALVWAMVDCGTKAQRKVLNRELAAECLNLVTDRHGIHTVLALLERYPTSRRTIVPALLPILGDVLLPDPVGAKAAAALISPATAADVLEAVGVKAIAQAASDGALQYPDGGTKRTLRFAADLLIRGFSTGDDEALSAEQNEKRADALVQLAGALQPRLVVLATNGHGNFVVQALIRALGAWGSSHKVVAPALQTAVNAFTRSKSPSLVELASHPNAAHVIGSLASSAATALSTALRPHLLKLSGDKHGSISLRRLVEQAEPANAANIAAALLGAMSQHVATFIADEHGNLVLQAILRALKPADRTKFFETQLLKSVVELSQHRFAAHVIHALVTGSAAPMDATGLNKLFGQLKRHLPELAGHLNGRFIVEALIAPFREAQQLLIDALPQLAYAQGAQGVIVKLYDCTDAAGRRKIADFASQQLSALATNKQGSLVVQKLLGRDVDPTRAAKTPTNVLDAVKATLAKQSSMTEKLRTDFFGRFVVQIAETGALPAGASAPSSSSGAARGRGGRGGTGGAAGRGASRGGRGGRGRGRG